MAEVLFVTVDCDYAHAESELLADQDLNIVIMGGLDVKLGISRRGTDTQFQTCPIGVRKGDCGCVEKTEKTRFQSRTCNAQG